MNLKTMRGLALVTLATLFGVAVAAAPDLQDFEKSPTGKTPSGFTIAVTGGGGAARWVIQEEPNAPSGRKVLVQTSADSASYRFPLCVFEAFQAKDVDVSVQFKPISGRIDQAAGLVWRYRDKDNYYIVRANALENNVVLYKVQNGKRADLPLKGVGRTYGKTASVPNGRWSTLRVVARGNLFQVYVNGKMLYEVEDDTFAQPGKVGMWTKADSVTAFDDLKMTDLGVK